jgi:uncharacterized membrane protein YkvA (DUF1232 family)
MLRALLGVAIALAVAWLALIVALLVTRPSGSRIREAVRLLPDTLRLLRRLATDRSVPRGVRIALWVVAALVASPIDLVPEFLPVIGPIDDVLLVALVLRAVVRRAGAGPIRSHWPGTPDGLAALSTLLRLPLMPEGPLPPSP